MKTLWLTKEHAKTVAVGVLVLLFLPIIFPVGLIYGLGYLAQDFF